MMSWYVFSDVGWQYVAHDDVIFLSRLRSQLNTAVSPNTLLLLKVRIYCTTDHVLYAWAGVNTGDAILLYTENNFFLLQILKGE